MMTKAQARYWWTFGDGYKSSGIEFDEAWDLFQEATKIEPFKGIDLTAYGQPSEIPESGTEDARALCLRCNGDKTAGSGISGCLVCRACCREVYGEAGCPGKPWEPSHEATQPPSKPSQPEEVAEDPGEGEEALEETRERCGGVLMLTPDADMYVCSRCQSQWMASYILSISNREVCPG